MNHIENNALNPQLGVTLEENASSLIQGFGRQGYEQAVPFVRA